MRPERARIFTERLAAALARLDGTDEGDALRLVAALVRLAARGRRRE